MGQFVPTDEQVALVDAFSTGGDIIVGACAGSGKTKSCELIAQSVPHKRLVYAAYNKKMADEAKTRFGPNTSCKTVHAYAFAKVGWSYKDRLNAARVPSWQAANVLGIHSDFTWQVAGAPMRLKPNSLAALTFQMVSKFCYSDDDEISSAHMPFVEGIDSWSTRSELAALLVEWANVWWDDAQLTSGGKLRYAHDFYLKKFQLEGGKFEGDVVLLDESQDSNLVTLAIVKNSSAQKILVGDENQQLYQWRGASDIATNFVADHNMWLSQSFRFGTTIADQANAILTRLPTTLVVRGTASVDSKIAKLDLLGRSGMDSPDAVLCRTNSEAIRLILIAQVQGISCGLIGGGGPVAKLAQAAADLQNGRSTSHPELQAFTTWAQVQEYAQFDSSSGELSTLVDLVDTYGIDTIIGAVDRMVPENRAQMVFSTVHKSKGLEFDKVMLASDFAGRGFNDPELRVQYVAVTRAKHVLDSSVLPWLNAVAKVDSKPVPEANLSCSHADWCDGFKNHLADVVQLESGVYYKCHLCDWRKPDVGYYGSPFRWPPAHSGTVVCNGECVDADSDTDDGADAIADIVVDIEACVPSQQYKRVPFGPRWATPPPRQAAQARNRLAGPITPAEKDAAPQEHSGSPFEQLGLW